MTIGMHIPSDFIVISQNQANMSQDTGYIKNTNIKISLFSFELCVCHCDKRGQNGQGWHSRQHGSQRLRNAYMKINGRV
jgi:hypothetical protein